MRMYAIRRWRTLYAEPCQHECKLPFRGSVLCWTDRIIEKGES
jgi:hypothetical protein